MLRSLLPRVPPCKHHRSHRRSRNCTASQLLSSATPRNGFLLGLRQDPHPTKLLHQARCRVAGRPLRACDGSALVESGEETQKSLALPRKSQPLSSRRGICSMPLASRLPRILHMQYGWRCLLLEVERRARLKAASGMTRPRAVFCMLDTS